MALLTTRPTVRRPPRLHGNGLPRDEVYRYIRSAEFARASAPSDPSKELRWLLPWLQWKLGGEAGPRGAPKKIPAGAWAVADAINAGEFERR